VLFGPTAAAGACGTDGLASRMRQLSRPAPGLEPPPRAGRRTPNAQAGRAAGPGA
jgi:hypothetical protein